MIFRASPQPIRPQQRGAAHVVRQTTIGAAGCLLWLPGPPSSHLFSLARDGADRDSKSRGRLGAAECGGVGTLGRAGCRQGDGVAERSVISASISAMDS